MVIWFASWEFFMAKKESYHTGEYKFRLPDRVAMSAELDVSPIMRTRQPRYWLRAAVLALVTLSVAINNSSILKHLLLPAISWICCPPTPTPTPAPTPCCYQTRKVVVGSLGLYGRPDDASQLLYTLRQGDSVRLLGQSHRCLNGEIWMLVGYGHIALPVEQVREGWVKADGIGEM